MPHETPFELATLTLAKGPRSHVLAFLRIRHWLPPIILCVLLAGRFFGDIESVGIHGDENVHTRTAGTYFSLFVLEGDVIAHRWFHFHAWDNPMIGKYLLGGAIWLKGGEPLVRQMEELPAWDWAYSDDWNLQRGRGPPPEILIPLRWLMAGFGLLSCIALYFLGTQVLNAWVGFVAALLLGFNPLTAATCRLVFLDAALLFFMTLAPIAIVALLKSFRRGRYGRSIVLAAIIGVVGALATGMKLNGALSLIVFGVVVLSLGAEAVLRKFSSSGLPPLRVSLLRLAGLLTVGGATSMLLFFVTQPNFYYRPLQSAETMLQHRATYNADFRERFQPRALDTIPKKVGAVMSHTILPGPFIVFPEPIIPIELIFLPLGLVLSSRSQIKRWRERKQCDEITVFLIWFVVTVTAITLWIPLDWDRYYLPLLPPISLMAAVGIVGSTEGLLPLATKLVSGVFHASRRQAN